MQLKSRAAVHLDNEGGSLKGIVSNTENTSLKKIKISRANLGDCKCWKVFFSSVWQYLVDLPFQLIKTFLPSIKILICFSMEITFMGAGTVTCLRYIRHFDTFYWCQYFRGKKW